MSERPPVKDWMTDWDHMDRHWTENPYAIWDKIRAEKTPIAHTERYGGSYLPSRFTDIQEIAADTEHFSSRQVVVRESQPKQFGGAPPITSDAPKHAWARRMLLPPFSPTEVKKRMGDMRAICNDLIDQFESKDTFDGARDYAEHIPVRVIAGMLGLPESDGDRFRHWINQIVVEGVVDDDANAQGLTELTDYFHEQIEARRARPTDDLISTVMGFTYQNGEPFKETHVLGSLRLILIAGIDTTWSSIGSAIWHLSRTPVDRERIAADSSLVPNAVEEFLRAFAPVTMARVVAKDRELNGCPFKAGQTLLLPFPAANRDPEHFERPNEVIIDREHAHRHVAFGAGIHRCIGMHLARAEIRTALETLLARVPVFTLAGEVTWARGPIRGPRRLPLKIG